MRRPSPLRYGSLLLALTACYGPSQDFPVGSELWSRSNPEFVESSDPRFQGPKKVTVAVLDGGVDYNHPRLRGHIVPFTTPESSGRATGVGFDLSSGAQDYYPHYSLLDPETGKDLSDTFGIKEHATHVAGLATLGDPAIRLIPIRVLPLPAPTQSTVTLEDLMTDPSVQVEFAANAVRQIGHGVQIACNQPAQVLNLSLGIDLSKFDENMLNALQQTLGESLLTPIANDCRRSLLVVAAGNEAREVSELKLSIPVTLEARNILGVGALTTGRRTAYYSNQGRFVDVYIRGSQIRSSVPGYAENPAATALLSGTSMATPLITHLAAQILEIAPALTGEQVRALILNTAKLETLDREPTPEEDEERAHSPLPAQRLGLVAQFPKALAAARALVDPKNSPEALTRLQSSLLIPPFEHGHSPF